MRTSIFAANSNRSQVYLHFLEACAGDADEVAAESSHELRKTRVASRISKVYPSSLRLLDSISGGGNLATELHLFELAVKQYFKPLCRELGVKGEYPRPNLFQLVRGDYAIRVRAGIGHGRDLLITLLRLPMSASYDDFEGEIGLGVVSNYYGERMLSTRASSEEDFLHQAQLQAEMTSRLLLPYLAGLADDFEAIQRSVNKQVVD